MLGDEPEERDSDRLRRLEGESSAWQRTERGKGFYVHDCPGWSDEHNRQIEIDRLRGEGSGEDQGGNFCGH